MKIWKHPAVFCLYSSGLLCVSPAVAQTDSLLHYQVATGGLEALPPAPYDVNLPQDKTASFTGTGSGFAALPDLPPVSPVYSGTQYSTLQRAATFFPVTAYPVRAATKVIMYRNGQADVCSGLMVSRRHVLTAAHCLCLNSDWVDSVRIAPAYDNGAFQLTLPTSKALGYYVFKSYYQQVSAVKDIALIELEEPIGQETGYLGFGFTSDDSFFANKVFHKFSYPGTADPNNPSLVYNGDTLYYNYGLIDVFPTLNYLGVNAGSAYGIPGQSGSSLFYADQTGYTSYGVLNYSSYLWHYRINSPVFHQFKQVVQSDLVSAPEPLSIPEAMVFPNPFSDKAQLETGLPCLNCTLQIYSVNGQLVKTQPQLYGSRHTINRDNLPNGFYYFHLSGNGKIHARGKMVVQ